MGSVGGAWACFIAAHVNVWQSVIMIPVSEVLFIGIGHSAILAAQTLAMFETSGTSNDIYTLQHSCKCTVLNTVSVQPPNIIMSLKK